MNFEKWKEKLEMSISWQNKNIMWRFCEEIENWISDISWQIWKIVEFRWDICPSCDSKNFSDWKCFDCKMWFTQEIDEKFEEEKNSEQERRIRLSEKNSKNWKKYEIFVNWEKVEYFHYKSRIKENEATLEIKYHWKKYFITVWFEKSHNRHFQDNSLEYDFFRNIFIKEPKNFDWTHKIVNSKKNWVYFDYNLAEKIAREILNRKF